MRIAVYPGAIAIHTDEEIKKNIEEKVFPQIIKALTEPPAHEKPQKPARKAKERPFACEGTFEEVNQYFLIKKWSDGLPIVPPTEEKVAEFLKYTPLPADHVIGELHPSMNPATVKSIAINGVRRHHSHLCIPYRCLHSRLLGCTDACYYIRPRIPGASRSRYRYMEALGAANSCNQPSRHR